jgi:hypothetical protein
MCTANLYVANDLWAKDRSYERQKYVCANCFSIKMALTTSPIHVAPILPEPKHDRGVLDATIEITNRAGRHVRVWVAAVPRHGPRQSAVGPLALDIPPHGTVRYVLTFTLDPARKGVISYRLILICQGAAEFYSLKYSNAYTIATSGQIR